MLRKPRTQTKDRCTRGSPFVHTAIFSESLQIDSIPGESKPFGADSIYSGELLQFPQVNSALLTVSVIQQGKRILRRPVEAKFTPTYRVFFV